MRVMNHHLCKLGNTYYFIKRVPKDVRRLHSSGWIKQSLKTANLPTARRLRDQLLKQPEAKWSTYRALPEGNYLSGEQLQEALGLRKHVLSGDDRQNWLQAVDERTAEIMTRTCLGS
jgi:hypothetical protein